MALLKNAIKLILAAGLLAAGMAVAEDIDLYQGGSLLTGNKPNVLILVDNSANWNSNAQGWAIGKQGESELNALSTVAGTLTSDVRVGLAFFVKGAGSAKDGGYIRYGVRDMNSTNIAALQNMIAGIKPNFNSENTGQQVATSNADYGAMMYEAYRYFSGLGQYAGPADLRDYTGNGSVTTAPYTAGNIAGNALLSSSGNVYQAPLSASAPCSKNFIIFIGNGFPSTSSTNPTTYSDVHSFNATQIFDEGTKTTYLDEWARHLHDKGIYSPPCAGDVCADGSISTYTIDVYKDHQDVPQTNLLKSAAKVGGGKYFQASSEDAIVQALLQIFNEVQAVNSVFTSASLPVSVNTQGTYLNQIYMGVFRPDSAGRPRWLGNLKQYKFGLTTDALGAPSIFLADADGIAAVNSQTGFISPSARSFWTHTITAPGFWAFNPTGVGLQYDSPDGDLVEKGAAAQQLRETLGLNGVSSRKVYTYDSSFAAGTLLSTAPFATTNTTLVGALSGTNCTVASVTRVGTTATANTGTCDLLLSGTDTVTISGGANANAAAFNGTWSVTRVDANNFTFSVTETPATPATGSPITVSAGSGVSQSVTTGNLTYARTTCTGVITLTRSGFNVTANTGICDLQLNATDTVAISGSSVAAYNQSWKVTKVDSFNFTFQTTGAQTTPATATTVISFDGTARVNLPSHGFISNQLVTITNATQAEYNGSFNVTVADSNNFTYTPLSSVFTTTNVPSSTATATTYNPPDGSITAGSSTLTCQYTGSPSSDTVSNATVTKATQSSATTMTIKVVLSSLPAHCGTALKLGGTGNNNRVTAFTLSGTGSTVLDGTRTVTGVGASCTAATTTAATGDLTLCFSATVTSTTGTVTTYAATTTVPTSPATTASTLYATGTPTRTVFSISYSQTDSGNAATATLVTTPTAHLFGSQTSVTVAGATQTQYNGVFTSVQGLDVSNPNQITYTIATSPANCTTGCGSAAKGSSVDASTLINWVRGVDNKEDENADGSLTDVRASVHGDVLHSRPIVINYGGTTGIVAFYGSNDSTLRAVKAGQASTDGVEKWAFVAPEHYSTMNRLYSNTPVIKFPVTSSSITPTPAKRNYFWDGNIGVYQSSDLSATHIFVTMRRGGRAIYAFDVSNPDTPKFLWKRSNLDTGFSELGQTWSEPKVFRLKKTAGTACSASNESTFTRALVFGAGYDAAQEDLASGTRRTPTMGRGIFVLNAADGTLITPLIQPGNDHRGQSNSAKLYSFPAEVTLLDTDGDGCVDRIYAVDTGANIFRLDIGDPTPSNWKIYKLASLGDIEDDGGVNDRKFLFAPEAVLGYSGSTQIAYVMAGAGDREQPLLSSSYSPGHTSIINRFFMVKDTIAAGTATTATTAVLRAELDTICDSGCNATFNASTTKLDVTSTSVKGWQIQFDSEEKSVNAPLTVAGTTFFGTNMPAEPTNSCTPNLGIARGYAINFLNGTSAVGDRTGNGSIGKSDLYANFVGGGLPPSPVSGVVEIDASTTVRFVIGSGGTGTEGSTIEGFKTQANPASNRSRVFWYFKKDQ